MSENQLCLIPQNEIELELDEELILVHIVRKPRKRLVLKITPEGVILSTPPHISNEKISLFLNQNKDWLLKNTKLLNQYLNLKTIGYMVVVFILWVQITKLLPLFRLKSQK